MCFRSTRIPQRAISRFKSASRCKGQPMDWFGAVVDGPLIVVRAIHFAATAVTAGCLVFRTVVAEPVLRSDQAAAKRLQGQTRRVAWIALAITIASAVPWLLVQA